MGTTPKLTHCPGCGLIVQPDWETCRFCRYDLAAARQLLAGGAPPPPPVTPPGMPELQPPPPPGSVDPDHDGTTDAPAGDASMWPPPPPPPPGAGAGDTWGSTIPPPPMPVYAGGPGGGPSPTARVMPIVAVLVLLAAGLAVYAVLTRDTGPGHPDVWDSRVSDLVSYVEDERGGPFDHPVYVDFLTATEYSELTRTDEGELSEEDLADLEQAEALFRALGLVEGDPDLLESFNDVRDSGTLAFYNPADERVTVRGTELTPDLRVTLVHELTHTWQDQHFDIEKLQEHASEIEADTPLRALFEADAARIEDMYIETLSEADRATYDGSQQDDIEEAGLGEVPDILIATFAAPYALGPPFLEVLRGDGGTAAVDAAFATPPATEEHLLDPFSYLVHDPAVEVEVPVLDDGIEADDSGTFGALGWFLLLAERTDPLAALHAVDGWGGDAYVQYQANGSTCVRIAFVGESGEATERMVASLDAWRASMPVEAGAALTRIDGGIQLQSCDPGSGSSLTVAGNASKALALPATRGFIAAGILSQGATNSQAACAGDAVIDGFTLDELSSDTLPPDFQARVQAVVVPCMTPG